MSRRFTPPDPKSSDPIERMYGEAFEPEGDEQQSVSRDPDERVAELRMWHEGVSEVRFKLDREGWVIISNGCDAVISLSPDMVSWVIGFLRASRP
jgi:hypothetical protein